MSLSPITVTPGGNIATLLASAHDDWEHAINHRFVNEIFAGTLDDDALKRYLIQDYQFFDAFLSMLGACVAYADSIPAKLTFASQLGMLANDEDGYFMKAFAELGVTDEEQTAPELTSVTTRFRDLMYEAANSRSYPKLLIMLVVAEGLYLDWGERGSTDDTPVPLPPATYTPNG